MGIRHSRSIGPERRTRVGSWASRRLSWESLQGAGGEGPRRSPGILRVKETELSESPGTPRRSESLGQSPGEEGAPQRALEVGRGAPRVLTKGVIAASLRQHPEAKGEHTLRARVRLPRPLECQTTGLMDIQSRTQKTLTESWGIIGHTLHIA